jgi:4'-phosphopantetheinyl transferase
VGSARGVGSAGSTHEVSVFVNERGTAAADRALLAASVALVLGCDASEVTVTRRCDHCGSTVHGRPVVAAPRPAFASLSRAGDLVAVAVSLAAPVGIDLESLAAVAASPFDDVALTPAERARVVGAVDPLRLRATLWTRKEALLKATGAGLRVDPSLVGIGADGTLDTWAAPGARPTATLLDVETPPGYVGTVALLG